MHDCYCCGEVIYSDDMLCTCCQKAGCEKNASDYYDDCQVPQCESCNTAYTYCTDEAWHNNCSDECIAKRAVKARKLYCIENADSTYRVAIFSRESVERAYGTVTPDNAADIAQAITGWGEYSRGVGRAFGTSPSICVLGRNVVVRQFCGLDI